MAHGTLVQKTGVAFYLLRRRDVPPDDRADDAITKLIGTVLLVSQDAFVITYERSCGAGRVVRRKQKCRSAGVVPVVNLSRDADIKEYATAA